MIHCNDAKKTFDETVFDILKVDPDDIGVSTHTKILTTMVILLYFWHEDMNLLGRLYSQ